MKRLMSLIFLGALATSSMAQTAGAPAQKNPPATNPPQAVQPASGCGCEGEPQPEVLATVNGVKITSKEVDESIKGPLKAVRDQVIELRRLELDVQINSRLLEAEAKKRGKTSTQMIQEEIISKVKDPTDEEVKAFFDKNKDKVNSTFEDAKPLITDYLRNQRQAELAKALADQLRAGADLKVIVKEATPPDTRADRDRVFATLNGQNITSANIEDTLQPLLIQAQKQIYTLRKREVDFKINDLLLEQEAQKRKITARAVIEADILPNIKKVTDEDARKFYDDNKAKLPGEFAQLRDQIIKYLTENEQQKAQTVYAEKLRSAASVQLFLKSPEMTTATKGGK